MAQVVHLAPARLAVEVESDGEVISRGWQSSRATNIMLIAGIVATVLYALGDLVSGLIFDGYSWADQVISELTATAAPSRSLMATVITVHTLLFIVFAVGVWRSAGVNRPLRWAAAMLFTVSVVALPLHIFFPLHGRGVEPTLSDSMHRILTVAWSLGIFAMVAFVGAAYRRWFRLYSIATLLALPTFGYLAASMDAARAEDLATPAIGLFERVNAYVLMAWLVTLAIILLRANQRPSIAVPDSPTELVNQRTRRITARRGLLACGVLYALLYPIVNDGIAAGLYEGYSRISQAVSELSAIGAPPHDFLTAVGPIFVLLLIGFGFGIWRSARGKRSLRIAGALVIAHGAMSSLWAFAPMSQREVIAAGGATSADTMHLVLSAATGLFVMAYVAATAVAFGWVFRLYSVATIVTALVFGILSGQVERIEAGDPTPYMGLLERIGIGAWLLWMTVVAVTLIRARIRPPTVSSPDPLVRVGVDDPPTPAEARFGGVYRIGGTCAGLAALLTPISVGVFAIWTPPSYEAGARVWFEHIQDNRFLGLLSLDLPFLLITALMIPVMLALFIALRGVRPASIAVAGVLYLIAVATYFGTNTSIELLSLSDRYVEAAGELERASLLGAGELALAAFDSTAFHVNYVLAQIAGILFGFVMLRTQLFTRATAYLMIGGNAFGFLLYVPEIGVALSAFSGVILWVWMILVSRRLLQLARRDVNGGSISVSRLSTI